MLESIRFPLTAFGIATSIATTIAALSASSVSAQDEDEFDRTPHRCIQTARIRSTDILDDRTIIFYLRGNKEVYRTYLPRECPGLERNDRFSYETRGGQLCDIDTITVLEQFGTRLNPSFTCRLGEFVPITKEEAENLKLEEQGQGLRRNVISAEPAELPAEGAAVPGAPNDDAASANDAPSAAPPQEERPKRSQRRGSGITAR